MNYVPASFQALQMQSLVQARAVAEPSIASGSWPLEFEIIGERHRFDALEDEWNALFQRSGRPTNVFQTFNWNWHWANHYLGSSRGGIAGLELSVITGRRNGRLVLVWPLVKERVRGVTQIFWMGEPVSQYGDVLIDDIVDADEVLRQSWAFLSFATKADVIRLRRVRSDAVAAPLFDEIGATVTDRQKAPYLDFNSAASYAEYETRYGGHARRNRRRLRRRLEERAGLTFERHHGGETAAQLAVEAVGLKAEWLKHRGLVSHAIRDKRMTRFFADAVRGDNRPTECVVAALKSGEETAALEVSFTCKGRLAMHVIVYNLKYEKAGAGVILMEQSLRDGFDEGLDIYDMLAPGDSYKLEWADATTDVVDYVKPLSLAGFVYARLYLGILRGKAKTWLKALPTPVRRVVSRRLSSAA